MSGGFAPGDIVECVDAGPSKHGVAARDLVEGARYTVFAVGVDLFGDDGVFLHEQESDYYAGGYLSWRFRKIGEISMPGRRVGVREPVPA